MRIGTCGLIGESWIVAVILKDHKLNRNYNFCSLGHPKGSLVITNKVYDGLLREEMERICCGKVYKLSTEFDQNFVQVIKTVAERTMKDVNVVCGKHLKTLIAFETNYIMNYLFAII